MTRRIDRLNRLEKAVRPDEPPQILICWCSRDDHQHDTDCECYGVEIDETIYWGPDDQIITVRYDRSPPIPTDNHKIMENE